MISTNEHVAGQAQDFAKFVELQQQHTETTNKLEQLEVTMNEAAQKAATISAEAYVVLQENLETLDVQLKALFELHPEWRGDKKSVATPFGSVEQRKSTELQVNNPALTVELVEARAKSDRQFKADNFLHVEKEPNLEAFESMTDEELTKFGIKRVTTERVTVKPAKVSVAKAVKAAKSKTTSK